MSSSQFQNNQDPNNKQKQIQYDPYGNPIFEDVQGQNQNYNQTQNPNQQQQYPMTQYQQNQYPQGATNALPYNFNNKQNRFNINNTDNQPQLGGLMHMQDNSNRLVSGGLDNESMRRGFIRKVYGILTCQLLLTVFLCYLTMSRPAFYDFQTRYYGVAILAMVAYFVIALAIACCPSVGRKYPLNYILLFIFTLSLAYLVSFTCGQYNARIVVMAAVFTLAITVSLTLYALTTKSDVTTSGSALFIISMVALVFGFFLIFTNNPVLQIIYCSVWALIYGFFIIYDTQLIVGGKKLEISEDDYIFAALTLYIDIIGLFLQLLQILGELSK